MSVLERLRRVEACLEELTRTDMPGMSDLRRSAPLSLEVLSRAIDEKVARALVDLRRALADLKKGAALAGAIVPPDQVVKLDALEAVMSRPPEGPRLVVSPAMHDDLKRLAPDLAGAVVVAGPPPAANDCPYHGPNPCPDQGEGAACPQDCDEGRVTCCEPAVDSCPHCQGFGWYPCSTHWHWSDPR